MEITVYKRHSKDCEHKADRAFRRCSCRMMLEWSENGKRFRVSAKTRSWTEAEQRARARMQDAHARTIGEPPKAGEPITLERAVEMFTAKKSSKHKQTQRKYQYTLRNLKAWAARNGRHYLADLTESDLEKYQASWTTLTSNYAKRNEQERLRSFFRYCCASAEIKLAYNPTAQLEHFNVTSDEPEDPYTEKEYKAIVAAVDRVPTFTGDVAERVKALISVMRYAGLSIQDAAILERDAVTPAQVNGRNCYRVQIRRSKTHTGVNNVVPREVGDALLKVANGNPKYVFWSGNGEPASTTKHWSARLKRVFDASGVKGAHSHRFRKTFGVDLLTHGAPLEMVSKALGHRNTVITERHYLKWVPKLQEQLAEHVVRTWTTEQQGIMEPEQFAEVPVGAPLQ
jgi:site-specific recombinase XerD